MAVSYPDRHHPVFFLQDALQALGATAEFARDERTEGCWGLIVNGKPMVWLIDNRHLHERAHEDPAAERLLQRGVLVCCAQQPDAERVDGKWLPLAVTPGYRPLVAPKLFDAAFVGTIRDATRSSTLTDIASRHTLSLGEDVFGDEAVRIYCEARCGVNIPTNFYDENAYDSANMRCFEVLATGTPLITKREPYLEELGLVHGENVLLYDTLPHIRWLIDKVLTHPKTAAITGARGAALAFERHTYRHRAEQVLAWTA